MAKVQISARFPSHVFPGGNRHGISGEIVIRVESNWVEQRPGPDHNFTLLAGRWIFAPKSRQQLHNKKVLPQDVVSIQVSVLAGTTFKCSRDHDWMSNRSEDQCILDSSSN